MTATNKVLIFDRCGETNKKGTLIDNSKLDQLKIESGIATFFESPFSIYSFIFV